MHFKLAKPQLNHNWTHPQNNITKVGFDMKMIVIHHPPPTPPQKLNFSNTSAITDSMLTELHFYVCRVNYNNENYNKKNNNIKNNNNNNKMSWVVPSSVVWVEVELSWDWVELWLSWSWNRGETELGKYLNCLIEEFEVLFHFTTFPVGGWVDGFEIRLKLTLKSHFTTILYGWPGGLVGGWICLRIKLYSAWVKVELSWGWAWQKNMFPSKRKTAIYEKDPGT